MKTCEIADLVSGELVGDGRIEITSVGTLGTAGPSQIAFSEKDEAHNSEASCILIGRTSDASGACLIRVDDPKLAFACVARALHPNKSYPSERHSTAIVAENAEI